MQTMFDYLNNQGYEYCVSGFNKVRVWVQISELEHKIIEATSIEELQVIIECLDR